MLKKYFIWLFPVVSIILIGFDNYLFAKHNFFENSSAIDILVLNIICMAIVLSVSLFAAYFISKLFYKLSKTAQIATVVIALALSSFLIFSGAYYKIITICEKNSSALIYILFISLACFLIALPFFILMKINKIFMYISVFATSFLGLFLIYKLIDELGYSISTIVNGNIVTQVEYAPEYMYAFLFIQISLTYIYASFFIVLFYFILKRAEKKLTANK